MLKKEKENQEKEKASDMLTRENKQRGEMLTSKRQRKSNEFLCNHTRKHHS